MATASAPKIFKNFINGEWVEARGGKVLEDRNPANTDELVGMFPASGPEDVTLAVESAKAAYKKWRLTPAP
jgi:alpha-ketoglutaric semialdehyde dehydrogenase